MLFRLVRPMRRKDSRNGYFQQRIPADVRPHAIGRTLEFQVGGETVSVRVTERSAIIKLSLRSSDPVEVKLGQAEATRQAELHWKALRQTAPVTLTHRHCVALAGRAYEAWTANSRRETTTAMEHVLMGRRSRARRRQSTAGNPLCLATYLWSNKTFEQVALGRRTLSRREA
jgi:hypothetical protein